MKTEARVWALGLALTAGIAVGIRSEELPVEAAGIIGVLLGGAGYLIHRVRAGERYPILGLAPAALVLLSAVSVGAASGAARIQAMEATPLRQEGTFTIRGLVVAQPRVWGSRTDVVLDVRSSDGRPAPGRVEVSLFGGQVPVKLGDVVEVETSLRHPDPSDRYERSKRLRSIVMLGRASADALTIVKATKSRVLQLAELIRERMRSLSLRALGKANAGILMGITIGDESLIPRKVMDDFRTSGLSHLTAVSGANVAMILGSALWVLRCMGTAKRAQLLICLGLLPVFAVVTRWEPSVTRATLVAAASLVAFFFGRRALAMHVLGLAYLVLLGVDPLLIASIGFQLSFAATAGILLWARGLTSMLSWMPRVPAAALGVTAAAQLAVTPLLVWHFGQVSTVALASNLAAFPLVTPATVVGFAAALAGLAFAGAGEALLFLIGPLLSLLRGIASFFAGMSLATVRIDAGTEIVRLLLIYLLLAGVVLAMRGRGRVFKHILALTTVVLMATFVVPVAGHTAPDGMRMTFLDVGQGDATLIESPAGARILVDGGPAGSGVASDLKQAGISRIDLMVLSHPHSDHVDGLEQVVERVEVRLIWHPGVEEGIPAKVARLPMEAPEEGSTLRLGDVEVEVLAPTAEFVSAAESADLGGGEGAAINDASLVLRISYGRGCVLMTGDIEEAAQQALLERHASSIRCSVLKAPHHGSSRIEESFVRAARPTVVAISVGENDYGHPTSTALKMFSAVGARVVRTDVSSDFVIEMDQQGRTSVRP